MKSDFWNEERVNILTANWPNMSGADVAKILGTTRNTVIGKAHRLKLAAKRRKGRAPVARKRRTRTTPRALPTAIPVPPEPVLPPQPTEHGLSILQLQEHHCREIVGSGEDGLARYCGAPKAGLLKARIGQFHSSYCMEHSGKNYQLPLPPR